MLMLETLTRLPLRLLLSTLLLAAHGCYKDSVVGVSDKPKPTERTPSPPGDKPSQLPPKRPSVILAEPREQVGVNNPILGDLDGDGFDDFLIQASRIERSPTGLETCSNYLFYGRADFPTQLSTADADASFASSAITPVSLGDINGDGFADFALGQERGYEIVFGDRTRRQGGHLEYAAGLLWEVHELPSPFSEGIALYTMNLRSAGDVNGDGYDDVLIGSATVAPPGEEHTSNANFGLVETNYLVLGHAGEWPSGRWEASWAHAHFGNVHVQAPSEGFSSGIFALVPHRAGDLDGDGHGDLIAQVDRSLFVFYGDDSLVGGIGADRADAELVAFGFRLPSALGDLDADGAGDLLRFDEEGQQLQVIYGSTRRWSGRTTVEPGLTIMLDSPMLGEYVAAIGDIDGNGAPELVFGSGSYGAELDSEEVPAHPIGALYAIRGTGERRVGDYALTERDVLPSPATDASTGAGIGATISLAGDVDGDGNADILTGAPAASMFGGEGSGAVYLIPSTPKPPD